ncbi:YdcH family protein [Litorimonas sp. RW-G-Af-16]|uniref:YdcH family protein n=1 Tax=Litorimonas sp. RW-G-Af-16 TaxID=3241168 RepID=UPI00390C9510
MTDDPEIPEPIEASEEPTEEELLALLSELRTEHRRIDTQIKALYETGVTDMIKIGRMKKIKLAIKDQIAYLENQLTPDIIA